MVDSKGQYGGHKEDTGRRKDGQCEVSRSSTPKKFDKHNIQQHLKPAFGARLLQLIFSLKFKRYFCNEIS